MASVNQKVKIPCISGLGLITHTEFTCVGSSNGYNPDLELDKRPNPAAIENIPQIKRKEMSIYRPTG